MIFSYDSVILYVFSGTKNTSLVANYLKKEFEKRDIPTEIIELGKSTKPLKQPSKNSLIGIGYPIHAFNAPLPVIDGLKELEESSNKQNVFVFKVSGEPLKINNTSSITLFKLLKSKGYEIFSEYHFLMPYNIWFKYSDGLANHMHRYSIAQSKLVVTKILSNEKDKPIPAFLRAHMLRIILKFQQPAAKLNGRLYTVDRKKCTLCGICEKGCPVANIKIINQRVNFYKECAMCMYCSMYCPVDAINIGILRFWKVNGPYNYKKLAKEDSVEFPFISEKTKGIKRLFLNHYKKLDDEFKSYSITV